MSTKQRQGMMNLSPLWKTEVLSLTMLLLRMKLKGLRHAWEGICQISIGQEEKQRRREAMLGHQELKSDTTVDDRNPA